MKTAISVILAVAFGALVGCGTESESSLGEPDKAAKASEAAKASKDAAAEQRLAQQTDQFEKCTTLSQPLDTKLNDLDSRLSVGMPFADYSKAVGDVKVVYDRLFRQMGPGTAEDLPCLNKVLTPLEAAFNEHVSAYNVWNDCINDTYCTVEGATLDKLQASWSKATRQIGRAQRGMNALNPAG